MNDLIQRSKLCMPERAQGGVLFSMGQDFSETLLTFWDTAGFDLIGADFVDHGNLLFMLADGCTLAHFKDKGRDLEDKLCKQANSVALTSRCTIQVSPC